MTSYNTGNPIGSVDVKDLYDNAQNLDEAVNTRSAESWNDRFGVARKTWWGMEQDFNADQIDRQNRFNNIIASSGYQFLGDYAAGIEITEYNQIVRDTNGEFWRVSGQVNLPYTTTGAGLPENDALTPLGDAVLRQELANPEKGAAMVARGVLAVDSIADLLALPEGQRRGDLRYLVKGYHAGSNEGGGDFVWYPVSAKTPDNGIVFAVPGVGLGRFERVNYRGNIEDFGGGVGIADNSPAAYLALKHTGFVVLTPGRGTYKFDSPIELEQSSVFDANGASISFGENHTDLFRLAQDIDSFTVRNISKTTLLGVSAGDFAYKNLFTSFTDTSTIIGFPTGPSLLCKSLLVENCDLGASRVFYDGKDELLSNSRIVNNEFNSEELRVRPCSVLINNCDSPIITGNRFSSDYNEDVLKISGSTSRVKIIGNNFRHLGSGGAELDIFTGLKQAIISNNSFFNTQVHRKQTGGGTPESGVSELAAGDMITNNTFETFNYTSIYWRGSFGNIQGNTFVCGFSSLLNDGVVIYLDSEISPAGPESDVNPHFVNISGNNCIITGTTLNDSAWFIRTNTDGGSITAVSVVGNDLYGGNRFLRGWVSKFVANTWKSTIANGPINASEVAYSNNTPEEIYVDGAANKANALAGTTSTNVINASNKDNFRLAGNDINQIVGGTDWQKIYIYSRSPSTVRHVSDHLELKGGVDFDMPARSSLVLMKTSDGWWTELSRTTPA